MRKFQHRQILQSVSTLYEATAEIRKLYFGGNTGTLLQLLVNCHNMAIQIGKLIKQIGGEELQTLHNIEAAEETNSFYLGGNTGAVMQLLADCQSMAVQVGSLIEQLEGEGTKTVHHLEAYCELLYKTNLELGDAGAFANNFGHLQELLGKIENSVKTEIKPDKLEILFVSYKASMSDSIESVYLAARADPNCNAIFLPVPYYDVNPDHSMGEMHYEGAECYGANIEVTNWQEYNVEVAHPDIIFTFYPFDWANHVTHIHPYYFCSNLKKYTDLLVYIPYFVVADDMEEGFAVNVGVEYADKVIVQTEKVRQTYIRSFIKDAGLQAGDANGRVVVFGSPKFDKVVNTKREDCTMPPEWLKLIAGKKVLLYNTSLSSILKGSEEYVKKLRLVMDVVKKRDDIVLWWRPHPLSESTYASLRAGLLEEYREIVANFKQNEMGVFDDSADLHRALAYADAMISDPSSVATLFEVTRRPMIRQNWELNYIISKAEQEEYLHSDSISFGRHLLAMEDFALGYPEWYESGKPRRNKAAFSRFVFLPDYEYGVSNLLDAIYELDKENAKAEYMMSFPEGDKQPYLYQPPIRIGDSLLFAPARARRWAFYSLDAGEWRFEEVPEELWPSVKWRAVFSFGMLFGSDIIFLPGESGAIAKYNIDTGEITYHRQWYTQFSQYVKNVDWGLISGALYYESSFLLISAQTNAIIELDPETVSVKKVHKLGSGDVGFRAGALIQNTGVVYLIKFRSPEKTDWEESIVKWNIKTGEVTEITNLPINPLEGYTQNALASFLYVNDELYVLPLQSDSILKIDLNTDTAARVTLAPEFDFFARKAKHYEAWAKDLAMPYVMPNESSTKMLMQLPYDYSLADLDIEKREITNKRKWCVGGIEELIRAKYNLDDKILEENEFFTIENFMDEISVDEFISACKARFEKNLEPLGNVDGTNGQQIYDYVKELTLREI